SGPSDIVPIGGAVAFQSDRRGDTDWGRTVPVAALGASGSHNLGGNLFVIQPEHYCVPPFRDVFHPRSLCGTHGIVETADRDCARDSAAAGQRLVAIPVPDEEREGAICSARNIEHRIVARTHSLPDP